MRTAIRMLTVASLALMVVANVPSASAYTGTFGYHDAQVYTIHQLGDGTWQPYDNFIGVDGYVDPPTSATIHMNGDYSDNRLIVAQHDTTAYPSGVGWIGIGIDKSYGYDGYSLHDYVYNQYDDYYAYGVNWESSLGEQNNKPAKVYYNYLYGYDAQAQAYAYHVSHDSINNLSEIGYFIRPYTQSVAGAEASLWATETPNPTQIGRSYFGSSNTSHALHIQNATPNWEIWDTTLIAGKTGSTDDRPQGYYRSDSNMYYNFVVFGPGN